MKKNGRCLPKRVSNYSTLAKQKPNHIKNNAVQTSKRKQQTAGDNRGQMSGEIKLLVFNKQDDDIGRKTDALCAVHLF